MIRRFHRHAVIAVAFLYHRARRQIVLTAYRCAPYQARYALYPALRVCNLRPHGKFAFRLLRRHRNFAAHRRRDINIAFKRLFNRLLVSGFVRQHRLHIIVVFHLVVVVGRVDFHAVCAAAFVLGRVDFYIILAVFAVPHHKLHGSNAAAAVRCPGQFQGKLLGVYRVFSVGRQVFRRCRGRRCIHQRSKRCSGPAFVSGLIYRIRPHIVKISDLVFVVGRIHLYAVCAVAVVFAVIIGQIVLAVFAVPHRKPHMVYAAAVLHAHSPHGKFLGVDRLAAVHRQSFHRGCHSIYLLCACAGVYGCQRGFVKVKCQNLLIGLPFVGAGLRAALRHPHAMPPAPGG